MKTVHSKVKTKLKCFDCGRTYIEGFAHVMFCPAHTCEECGSSFPDVIEKGKDGKRRCDSCLEGGN